MRAGRAGEAARRHNDLHRHLPPRGRDECSGHRLLELLRQAPAGEPRVAGDGRAAGHGLAAGQVRVGRSGLLVPLRLRRRQSRSARRLPLRGRHQHVRHAGRRATATTSSSGWPRSIGRTARLACSATPAWAWCNTALPPSSRRISTCIAPWEGTGDLFRESLYEGGIPSLGFNSFIAGSLVGSGYVDDNSAMAMQVSVHERILERQDSGVGKDQDSRLLHRLLAPHASARLF